MNSKVEEFRALHVPGNPLILLNIWDAGSANVVAAAGARAIATGSYGVAEAQGFKDGEGFPFDRALDVLRGVARMTDLPITFDMESGYGVTAEEVGRSVSAALAAGAVGINLEDRMPGCDDLTPLAQQAAQSQRQRGREFSSTPGLTYSAASPLAATARNWSPLRLNAPAPMRMRGLAGCLCRSPPITSALLPCARNHRCR